MDSPPFSHDWVGRTIEGRFALIEWLSGSERGGVFLTELVEGPRTQKVAIKLIPAGALDAEARYAGWTAAMKLAHPHLLRVFRTGRSPSAGGPLVYAVMEYADEVLGQVIPERPITSDEAAEMLDPLLDVLAYLHRNGFVHGRLKPANILVVDNQLKLSEDNLRIGERRRIVAPLTVYDAPEAATYPAAPSADLWSLGVSLVEALTQRPPVFDRSVTEDPAIPESITQPLAGIARNCLRRSPSRRWSIDQVKAHLEGKSVDSAAVPAARAENPAAKEEKEEEKTPSTKLRIAALIAAALLLVVGLAVFLMRPHHPPSAPAVPQSSAPSPQVSSPVAPAQTPTQPAQTQAAPSQPSPALPAPPASSTAPPSSSGAAATGQIAQRVLPDVPRKASDTIHGKVDVAVRVNVDAQGQVTNATLASPGPSHYFANLALEASRKWKFTPSQAAGPSIASVWTLHYEFRQSGIEANAVRESP